jgi:predicted transcriptional regulator
MPKVKRPASLRSRRKAAGLTIYKLAKLAGLKWDTVHAVETGQHSPQRRTLRKIEAVLRDLGV